CRRVFTNTNNRVGCSTFCVHNGKEHVNKVFRCTSHYFNLIRCRCPGLSDRCCGVIPGSGCVPLPESQPYTVVLIPQVTLCKHIRWSDPTVYGSCGAISSKHACQSPRSGTTLDRDAVLKDTIRRDSASWRIIAPG